MKITIIKKNNLVEDLHNYFKVYIYEKYNNTKK